VTCDADGNWSVSECTPVGENGEENICAAVVCGTGWTPKGNHELAQGDVANEQNCCDRVMCSGNSQTTTDFMCTGGWTLKSDSNSTELPSDENARMTACCVPPANTCAAVYGENGTENCSIKANLSGFWSNIGFPYDQKTALPSAIYDERNSNNSCDEKCKDMEINDGVEDCCNLEPEDDEFCQLFMNMANAKAGNCDHNNYENCPDSWPSNWEDDTYWNDYLWIRASCGGGVGDPTPGS
tara:strand:- start:1152 stop:1871 length:720 start_codon:yes stop_codon:yes gene_type:complete